MKQLRYFVLIALSTVALGLISCKDDGPGKTDEEKQLEALAKVWTISSATVDGSDVSSNFTGLTVTFTEEGDYSTNGSYGPVWPSSGTFELGTDLNTVVRDDGVTLTIALDNISLTASFNYNTLPGGRTSGILGDYVFQFTTP
jgi:hypothetical protein